MNEPIVTMYRDSRNNLIACHFKFSSSCSTREEFQKEVKIFYGDTSSKEFKESETDEEEVDYSSWITTAGFNYMQKSLPDYVTNSKDYKEVMSKFKRKCSSDLMIEYLKDIAHIIAVNGSFKPNIKKVKKFGAKSIYRDIFNLDKKYFMGKFEGGF